MEINSELFNRPGRRSKPDKQDIIQLTVAEFYRYLDIGQRHVRLLSNIMKLDGSAQNSRKKEKEIKKNI